MKTLRESINRRLLLARRTNDPDPQKAAHARALALVVCGADPVLWINDWVWTYDPRGVPSKIPFDLFSRQVECIRWLEEREAKQEDGIIEKSRDMGATWLVCAYMVHRWLYRPGFAGGIGSRKLELVDKIGDPKTIFDKLRFIINNLPSWQLPVGFRPQKHDNFCNLINPDNGGTIAGEGGDSIGRGGRTSMYFVDESAHLERALKVEASLSANSNVKIHVSTPNGPNNFYRMARSGRYPVFTFRWQDDPRKDEEWYEKQKELLDPVTLAQEVDLDYTASVEGITIPAAWAEAAKGFNAWLHHTHGKFLPAGGKMIAGLDISAEGGDETVLTCRHGAVVDWIKAWGKKNTSESAYKAIQHCRDRKVSTLYYDSVGVGAGVKGVFDTKENLPFSALGVNAGATPTYALWPDGRTSKDRFANFKAEMWWKARERFERTYEYRTQGIEHPLEDLISIPNNDELVRQLSSVLHFYTDTGKIKIESKKELRKRGIKSPDYAESLLLSLIDIPAIQGAY